MLRSKVLSNLELTFGEVNCNIGPTLGYKLFELLCQTLNSELLYGRKLQNDRGKM